MRSGNLDFNVDSFTMLEFFLNKHAVKQMYRLNFAHRPSVCPTWEQSRGITFGNTILKMQYRIWDHDMKNLALRILSLTELEIVTTEGLLMKACNEMSKTMLKKADFSSSIYVGLEGSTERKEIVETAQ